MNYDNWKLQAPEFEELIDSDYEFIITNYDDTMTFDTKEEAQEHLEFLKEEAEYSLNMEIKEILKN